MRCGGEERASRLEKVGAVSKGSFGYFALSVCASKNKNAGKPRVSQDGYKGLYQGVSLTAQVSSNRGIGFNMATGEFGGFCVQDDKSNPFS
jgi:hypothetical protein